MPSFRDRASAIFNAASQAWRDSGRPAVDPSEGRPVLTKQDIHDTISALSRMVGPQWPSEPIRSTPGTVAADAPYISRFPYIQGPSMDPASVSSALMQANQGYMSQFCDLLTEQRNKVPHLHAVLSTRELAISGCKWRTIPKYPGGSKRSVKIANKINEYAQMRIAEIPQLGMAFRHLAGGIYYHASAVEIKWKRDRFGVGVEGLYGIQPKRLSYAVSWRIHLWDELGNEYDPKLGIYPGVDIFATWPDRFAVHTPMPMGPEIPTRQGLGQVLTFYSMFSIWTVRDWMKFSELFGQPWRIAYFEKNADAADIQLAKQMLDRMSSMTTAVLPATAKFELEQPDGHNTVHHMLTTYLDAAMSKAVLGQTLTTEAPGHGTHALGKVQDRVRDDIARDDRVAMSETFHRYVLKPLIRKQFGQELCDLYCPTFELYPAASDDLQGEYTRAMGLADRGVPIECDWARSHFTMAPRPEGKQTQLYLYPMAQGANGGPPPLTEGEKRPKSPAEGGDDNGKDDNREGAGDIDDGE